MSGGSAGLVRVGSAIARLDLGGIQPVSGRYRHPSLLEFRILGSLEVVDVHGRVALGGPRQRATLAILLLSVNRVVSVDQLADDLYAGAAPVTALKQVQRQISELRKALGSASVIETRTPGYLIRLDARQFDLAIFERLTAEAGEALAGGDPHRASDLLRRALGLWRGAPLADLTYESFARAPIERLEEIRLAALEQRIEADLAAGRQAVLVAELEQLIVEHPEREGLHGQLMLALYRSGRQVEALSAYRNAQEALMAGFGIEPSRTLRQLERQILAQDSSLEPAAGTNHQRAALRIPARSVLAAPADESDIARVVALAEPFAKAPERELIMARLVADDGDLTAAIATLESVRGSAGISIRIAAFTTAAPAAELVRLANAYDVELVLVGAGKDIAASEPPAEMVSLLVRSPADVGVIAGPPVDWALPHGVFVPFGGTDDDWAALELAGYLASAAGLSLRLVGTRGDPARGRRDASRLIAHASLALQRLVGIPGEPLLVEPTVDALVEAVEPATLVVAGLPSRWQTQGFDGVRRSLLRAARPLVLVHRGPRPGALAPHDARTRFSWSLAN